MRRYRPGGGVGQIGDDPQPSAGFSPQAEPGHLLGPHARAGLAEPGDSQPVTGTVVGTGVGVGAGLGCLR